MILHKLVHRGTGFVLYALCGAALAAEPLSTTGLSDSYVSHQPPVLATCQSATQQPEAGHSAGKGVAPCPLITAPVVAQGLSVRAVEDPLSTTPRTVPVMELQYLETARQLYDAYMAQQAALSGIPLATGGNPTGPFR
jgi:hypothetical protein